MKETNKYINRIKRLHKELDGLAIYEAMINDRLDEATLNYLNSIHDLEEQGNDILDKLDDAYLLALVNTPAREYIKYLEQQ